VVQRIQSRIVDVGLEHSFAEVVEHDGLGGAAQPAEGLLVQLGPGSRARLKGQQTNAFAAVSEREYEQARAAITAGARVAHQGPGAVVDLRFLAGTS